MSETQILGLRNEDGSGAAGVSMSRETAAEPVTSLHEVWRKELSSAVSLQRLWWRWGGGGVLLWEKARQWEQEGVSSEPTGLCFRLYVCVCQSGEYKQRKEMIYSVYLHCESRRRCREREVEETLAPKSWRIRTVSKSLHRLMPVGSEHDPCVDTGRQSGDIRTVIPL